mgnify:FL=1
MKPVGWVWLAVGLILLNLSVTFANIWPTFGIRLTHELSAELAALVLGLMIAWRWRATRSVVALRVMSAFWVVLVLGRYVEVTARSLYGRDINLFWDLQHVPNVGAMFSAVADPFLRIGFVAALLFIPIVLYIVVRLALVCVVSATSVPKLRLALSFVSGVVLLVAVAQNVGARVPERIQVAAPVTSAYLEELSELVYEMTGAGVRSLAPPLSLQSNLSGVSGADVFLIFLESYGTVSWDRPEFASALVDNREQFASDITDTGRAVVSGRVESTTFGGESWLAHISLLSGTEVRDPGTNKRLMAQDRDTLVKLFGRHGYRTVAVMPGLQRAWPQGEFYGFEEIYDLARLDYRGPPFGWWDLNDQFALARIDSLEIVQQTRRPAFVFFPTVTTHAPFVPTPPYQSDWSRLLSDSPYDQIELDRSWSEYPDWLNLGPSYVKALGYAYKTIGGYLRLRASRDLVLILVGDHQPPALVSGEGASWDVPIHVITTRQGLLDNLKRHGFVDGLSPDSPTLARMDTLLPLLLDVFDIQSN